MSFRTGYLGCQSAAVVLWWALLALAPGTRAWFLPATAPATYLWAFLPADLLLVAGGSAHAAVTWRGGAAPPSFWIAAGALWFGTAYLVVLASLGEIGWLGTGLMLAASTGMLGLGREA